VARSNSLLRLLAAWVLLAPLAIRASDLPQLDAKDAAHLSELISLSSQEQLSSDQIARLDLALSDSNSAVKAVALALAYKYEPARREALFPGLRDTFHYRLPPETKTAPLDEFTGTLRQIENINPELGAQGHALLGYLYFREHHLQFLPPDKAPVSAATLLRTVFLSSLYRDSDVDTLALIKRFYEYQKQ
jgi:hypothetical protein